MKEPPTYAIALARIPAAKTLSPLDTAWNRPKTILAADMTVPRVPGRFLLTLTVPLKTRLTPPLDRLPLQMCSLPTRRPNTVAVLVLFVVPSKPRYYRQRLVSCLDLGRRLVPPPLILAFLA